MHKISVKTLTGVSLFIALEIVLSRYCSIATPVVKIGFAFVPLALCATLYGPVWGAVAGGLSDFLGAILFPIGPYFPGFTLTTALSGLVYGLFFRRRSMGIAQVCAATAINNLVFSLCLNTLWISILYGSPFVQLLSTRLFQCALMIPLQIVVLTLQRQPVTRLAHSRAVS